MTNRLRVFLASCVLMACSLASTQSAALDCSMEQMEIDPRSVIAPCSEKLQRSDLSEEERGLALLIRGRGYHRSGQIPLAAIDYDQALELIPNNDELWMSRANVYFRSKDYLNGERFLAKAYQLNPQNALVLAMYGAHAMNAGQLPLAYEYLTRALTIDPTEPYARGWRAEVLFRAGYFERALQDADILVTADPAFINRKGYLDENGRLRDFHIVALVKRGHMLADLRKHEQAEQDFNSAVAYKRSAESLAARAGFLLNRQGRIEEALANSEEAAALDPDFFDAFYDKGLILLRLKRFQDAFVAFDRSLTIKPQDAEARFMRARMHREFGRTDEAVQDMEAALRIGPYLIKQTMPALRHAGYWRSSEEPREITNELRDALRACMIDPTCN